MMIEINRFSGSRFETEIPDKLNADVQDVNEDFYLNSESVNVLIRS
jgi:hypothetical protein